jgi:hypothetical protein
MTLWLAMMVAAWGLYVVLVYRNAKLRQEFYRKYYPDHPPHLWRYGTGWWEYPSFWWWHTFMDGTWFCNCTRSKEMKRHA